MQTHGIPNDTERADLIAYLRMLSDAPIPLLFQRHIGKRTVFDFNRAQRKDAAMALARFTVESLIAFPQRKPNIKIVVINGFDLKRAPRVSNPDQPDALPEASSFAISGSRAVQPLSDHAVSRLATLFELFIILGRDVCLWHF